MEWMTRMAELNPVAWAVLVLSAVGAGGLVLSSLKVRGVGIGVTGVLFAGILIGHLGIKIEATILEFVREFGLILFVFTIGLQLGPGFFASLRKQGLKLNALAVLVVGLGVGLTLVVGVWGLGVDLIAALGLLTGATTNTPSLGALQQTLQSLGGPLADQTVLPALAYAAAYPGGVLGIIASLLLLQFGFRINPKQEAEADHSERVRAVEPVERMNVLVTNTNLDGLTIGDLPGRAEIGVVVSRIRGQGQEEVHTATEQTVVHVGDVILAIGTRRNLEKFRVIVGLRSDADLSQSPGRVITRKVAVTRKEVLGKTIDALDLDARYNVTVTRVNRADLEMTALGQLALQFGDVVQLVGEAEPLELAARELGNSLSALNETKFVPIFVGIALGVLCGMLPLHFPGIPVPVRLGLAGGPLLLAIILSRIGRIGSVIWYMPANANLAFRELGIVLFLACVGLKAGEKFFATVFSGEGLLWIGAGLLITMIPMLLVGALARAVLKLNFTTISGLLAGSMTDPPALAFAHAVCKSDAPAIAYATVYPLTMLLRIISVQILALILCR